MDAASHSIDALTSAIALAGQLEAELTGLFIEDIDLLRSAQLPFAREIIADSGRERLLTSADIERSLRAWSAEMQNTLIKEARKAQIKYSFRTVRGRRLEALMTESGVSDLLIFSRARYRLTPALDQATNIGLIYDGSEESQHGIAILGKLAAKGLAHVTLINTQTQKQAQEHKYDIHHGAEWLTQQGITVSMQNPADKSVAALVTLLKRVHASLLLVPANNELCKQSGQFRQLESRLDCPLVIVR
jgi:hypothetical protein